MKKILIHFNSPDLWHNVLFNTMDINRMNEAWIRLKEKLSDIGYNLQTSDANELSDCAYVIFLDSTSVNQKNTIKDKIKLALKKNQIKKRGLYKECLKNGMKDKIALIIWESRSIDPGNYDPKLHDKFPVILTWDDDLVDNKKFFKFYHPTPHRQSIARLVPFSEKKMLVLINANKSSKIAHDLYSERRNAAKFFEKIIPDQFDLYGPKWNKPVNRIQKIFPFLVKKFSSFRGIASDKITTLSKYKFSVCYENLAGENGYISEKIFDCFYAQTVPIYWGAENVGDYIDANAFIDRRRFKNNSELLDYINNIDEVKYNGYLDAINRFLKSEKYQLFLPENYADSIINAIKHKL